MRQHDDIVEREQRMVRDYQKGRPSDLDNRISFLPGVASHLVRLNGLLRPLVHREWVRMIAKINKLEGVVLEARVLDAVEARLARIRGA